MMPPARVAPPPPAPPIMATTASSQVRQNYHQECEAAINHHINLELYAYYTFLSMAYHFDRHDVALKNFTAYFLRQSHEVHQRAEMLLKLQNQRGGRIVLSDIKKPDLDDWESGLNAVQCALQLEQDITQSFLDLHQLATDKCDPQMCHFLEKHFLPEQVKTIKELGDHVTSLRKLGAPDASLADYLFDKFNLSDRYQEN